MYKVARVHHLIQQVQIISYMEITLQSITNFFNISRLKRYIQKNLYAYLQHQQGRYVSLSQLKKSKMISIDVEESLKEKASKHHSNQAETTIEEKISDFSNKLDMIMEQLASLTNQQRNHINPN